LPELVSVSSHLFPQGKVVGAHRSGMRDCTLVQQSQTELVSSAKPEVPTTPKAAPPVSSWSELLSKSLWQPLSQELGSTLTDLSRLHVVTHGELHLLPLTLGAPVPVSLYPGLIFYWQQRQQRQSESDQPEMQALKGLTLKVHSPEGLVHLPPIPFVHAESQLVAQSWSEVDEVLDSITTPSMALHLACHGMVEQGSEDACLIVGANERLGLQELLRSDLRAPIVYLSACLVGRTREDADGDPLGLVSAFFLRGARTVVAALMPIDDFFAPLLAHLFHRALHWQHQQGRPLDGVAALTQAKEQLLSGCWHPAHLHGEEASACEQEVAHKLSRAYARPLTDLLSSAIAGIASQNAKVCAQMQQEALHEQVMNVLFKRDWTKPDFIGLTDGKDLAWHLVKAMHDEAKLNEDQFEHKAAQRLMSTLFERRQHLHRIAAVQNLCVAMQVFGSAHK
jgi:hypothetical protein